jgi:RNA-binding protein 5/10
VLSWYAVQDFLSVDDARMLMESEARDNMVIGGQQLFLDYSSGPPVGSSGQGPAGPAGLDWICEMCSAVNFSRCTGRPSSRAVWSEAHVLCG